MKVWNLESWLALYRTNYIFNILYYSFFPHQLVPSFFFFFFFFLLFYHPHTSSHTRQSHTHTLLSFKFPLIFVITCCLPLSSTFFLCVHLLQLTSYQCSSTSSHLNFFHFSLKFLTFSLWLFCFALFFL